MKYIAETAFPAKVERSDDDDYEEGEESSKVFKTQEGFLHWL